MLRKIVRKNKKAQVEFSPIVFIAVIISLILLAPILVRMIGTVTGTFFTQMNSSGMVDVTPVSDAVDKVYNFFDYLIIIAMFFNIIILFISAWFIDTNPVFVIIYIMVAFIFVLFLPNLMDAVDQVWVKYEGLSTLDTWGSSSLNLTFVDWIRSNMVVFSVIIIALTGILIYAKFKYNNG